MTEDNILGRGAQGVVYKGEWHGFPAAFKVSESKDDGDTTNPMARVTEMQNKMKEVYDLIDLRKTIHENLQNQSETEPQERTDEETKNKRNNGIYRYIYNSFLIYFMI